MVATKDVTMDPTVKSLNEDLVRHLSHVQLDHCYRKYTVLLLACYKKCIIVSHYYLLMQVCQPLRTSILIL